MGDERWSRRVEARPGFKSPKTADKACLQILVIAYSDQKEQSSIQIRDS